MEKKSYPFFCEVFDGFVVDFAHGLFNFGDFTNNQFFEEAHLFKVEFTS